MSCLEVLMLLLLILSAVSATEQGLVCHQCYVKDHCLSPEKVKRKNCTPGVSICVKKEMMSRVTGAVVTERYCGWRDDQDSAKDNNLKEPKCYSTNEETDRRITTTLCYCYSDYCNHNPPPFTLKISLLSSCLLLAIIL